MISEELKIIIQKAAELYKKYGIRSVSMDDLAKSLGISKKTIYTYIKDKKELIVQIVEEELKNQDTKLQEIIKKNYNSIEELFVVNREVHRSLEDYSHAADYDLRTDYRELHLKISQFRRERMFEFISKNMAKGIDGGYFRSNLNVDLITRLYIARLDSMCVDEYFIHFDMPIKNYLIDVLEYHIRGIANEKGLKMLDKHIIDYRNN